ncbi:maltase 2-like [Leptopilina heterotoma]|uniref:maltase 2-like n=1 Tax=Leptopilina heterotoma TaxID=63436 RepID=UPI001CA905A0|nr:maltase 2-like [Leptopilina heterotoma]
MFKLTLLCIIALSIKKIQSVNNDWWKNAVIYQIYPRSFKDSNADGIGDLNGITDKMDHIKDIGADALWLSPIYTSPQADFGYDIANFTNVDPGYGTLTDFDNLVTKAKSLGLKVILDFVPNHSSTEHQWFKNSIQRIKPYDEYYVWRDAKMVNGQRKPPNNWLSTFKGTAWEWNEQRGQYYLHQFAIGQPDLNYRSALLNQAMKDVLTFWMNRGVDGFRIDVINHVIEDSLQRDEPLSNDPSASLDDYNSLLHIYTKDQNESYDILNSWRVLLDRFASEHQTDAKFLITEAYATLPMTIRYYSAGSVPFNFMFITDLNGASTAMNFKRTIDNWLNSLPKANVSNWVVGNHDNHRIASRYGVKKADMITMLSTILPGITVVYNGDEIGMIDREFTWKETVDVAGCNLGPDKYQIGSRDPERTPFQWDDTTSAGFSTSENTWLPVNSNYKELNLAAQKAATTTSHYKVFKSLTTLKKKLLNKSGKEKTDVTLITPNVLGIVRRLPGTTPIALVINTSDAEVKVDAMSWLNIPLEMSAYTTSVDSGIPSGTQIETNALTLPGSASIILTSQNQMNELLS